MTFHTLKNFFQRPATNQEIPCILVVDDDFVFRKLLQAKLEKTEGYKVTMERDGSKALEVMERIKPQLVILDWSLPGLSGLAILRRLRGHSRLRGTPVIMVTGRSKVSDMETAAALGVQDYMTKPIHLPRLMTAIKKYIYL